MVHPLLAYHYKTRGWWDSVHHYVQETYWHGPVPTVNHLSDKFSVIHTLSHRAQTVCSNPEPLCKEKSNLIGLITRAPQVPSLLPMKLKPRVPLSYPTHKVSVKVSRRSVEGMTYRPTSKVVVLSGTYWSPQGQRPYGQQKWGHILVPMWWPLLWWWIHKGNLQDLRWKIQRVPEGPLTHSSAQ